MRLFLCSPPSLGSVKRKKAREILKCNNHWSFSICVEKTRAGGKAHEYREFVVFEKSPFSKIVFFVHSKTKSRRIEIPPVTFAENGAQHKCKNHQFSIRKLRKESNGEMLNTLAGDSHTIAKISVYKH